MNEKRKNHSERSEESSVPTLVKFNRVSGSFGKPQDEHKAAFTLAEVLITLGIIGVVAAMTLPTMITKYQKQVTVSKLQKSYSALYQAINHSITENGMPNTWDLMDPETTLKNNIGKYLKVSKYYPVKPVNIPLCHEKQVTYYGGDLNNTYAWLNKVFMTQPFGNKNASLLTNDGVCIGISDNTVYGTSGVVFIDINSSIHGPNIAGKDLFLFYFDDSGRLQPYDGPTGCRVSISNNGGGGSSCAAKIMRDGWQIKDDYPW